MKDIGNQRFSDSKVNTNAGTLRYKDKVSEAAFIYINCHNFISAAVIEVSNY